MEEYGSMKIKPYDYQKDAIDSVFQFFFNRKKGNPLVVAPTGSGKSVMIAHFCDIVISKDPEKKILIIGHVKEIIKQNYNALKNLLPKFNLGIYSSGLKSKEIKDITVAGIQSIYNKPELFDQFDVVLVDEAHTIPHGQNGIYHKFFSIVKKPVIGFTATPYRLGHGYLHKGDGRFFHEIVYSIDLSKLQNDGKLCKLSTKRTKKRLKTDGIKKRAGDFVTKELSSKFDREKVTNEIIDEILLYKIDRKKWLLFAIDVNHCENIKKRLRDKGITCESVHSRMTVDRDKVIDDYKHNKYQALVTVGVLTTGFDDPEIDLIPILRPTSSPVLHVQMIGRGLRQSPNKKNCLVLDFAGNLMRNGPIDNPIIKQPITSGNGNGEPIMKECDQCYEIVHAAVRICPACGKKFLFRHNLLSNPSDNPVVTTNNRYKVNNIKYYRYLGKKKNPILKVSYITDKKKISEYICLEHSGYPKHKANQWWRRRSRKKPPDNIYKAIELCADLRQPKSIVVTEGKTYPEIIDHIF